MNAVFMIATLVAYFLVLLFISHRTSRSGAQGNDAFFRAGRRSPWWMVAFGMIGASVSGVTFISVPGWTRTTGMTYLQMCLGFVVGYVVVATVLLPLYYKLRLTSIYSYLGTRFGKRAHGTGALFFVLSKLTGAAARLYLVCLVLHRFVVMPYLGNSTLGFVATAVVVLLLIWAYTQRGGIQTIVRTDALQTACLLIAAAGILFITARQMNLGLEGMVKTIGESPMCRMWEWDATNRQAFWRQFLSGVFIVVVMTGLDQDMMQKNLTCRSLREAQKNMCTYGLAFIPVNALFLALGVLLYTFCAQKTLTPPAAGDDLLPWLVSSGALGTWVGVPFTVGIVAAAFSSADSALTALTTTVCIDILRLEERNIADDKALRLRRCTHVAMVVLFLLCIVAFKLVGNNSIINAVYVMAGYTYGPLLGLYAYGLFTRRSTDDRWVPAVCVCAPLVCAALDHYAPLWWGYTFGYELLMLNGALTFAGLWFCSLWKSCRK